MLLKKFASICLLLTSFNCFSSGDDMFRNLNVYYPVNKKSRQKYLKNFSRDIDQSRKSELHSIKSFKSKLPINFNNESLQLYNFFFICNELLRPLK